MLSESKLKAKCFPPVPFFYCQMIAIFPIWFRRHLQNGKPFSDSVDFFQRQSDITGCQMLEAVG